MADDDIRDYLRLALTPGIGGVSFRVLMEHFGSAQAALGAGEAEIARLPGFGPARAGEVARARAGVDVEAELDRAAQRGVKLVTFKSAEYPVALAYLAAPPPVLYVRGTLLPQDAQAFAIVGSRRSSLYGQEQAERFATALAGVGFTVVSGLARGIDLHAHVGALKAGGRTVAVLGNGLSTIYPPEHAARADEIAASGAVISEFPMDTGPAPENFPRRNRIIAGLSLGVLVIEAGQKSGALITANYAGEQGKDVFAIPGRIDNPFSQGANRLIQQGAKLVQSLDDILEEYPDLTVPRSSRAKQGGAPGNQGGAAQGGLPFGPRLEPQEEAILAALDGEPLTSDQIAERSKLALPVVASNLTMLELKRLVQAVPGQRFARRQSS